MDLKLINGNKEIKSYEFNKGIERKLYDYKNYLWISNTVFTILLEKVKHDLIKQQSMRKAITDVECLSYTTFKNFEINKKNIKNENFKINITGFTDCK